MNDYCLNTEAAHGIQKLALACLSHCLSISKRESPGPIMRVICTTATLAVVIERVGIIFAVNNEKAFEAIPRVISSTTTVRPADRACLMLPAIARVSSSGCGVKNMAGLLKLPVYG